MKWVDETVPDSMRAWSWASRTFLVFGESAETRPSSSARSTGRTRYSTLLSWRGSIGGLTRHDRGGEDNNWARAPA